MRPAQWPARRASAILAVLVTAFLTPAHPSAQGGAGRRAVTAAGDRDARAWDAQITRMLRDGQLRSRGEQADPMLDGRSHERLDQYHQGVRVFGGELVRQADGGQTVSVIGSLYTGIRLDSRAGTQPRGRGRHRRGHDGGGGRSGSCPRAGRPADRRGRVCPHLPPARPHRGRPHGLLHRRGHRRGRAAIQRPPDHGRDRAGRAQRHQEGQHDGAQRHLPGDGHDAPACHLHLRPEGQPGPDAGVPERPADAP